ncbi:MULTISPECIES: EAL domain-containing protein [unclassified Marinobacter]|uniref:EAL domain-containing response regulator n=1 Tax=unclassified Marinobacter TaxID=83889 RepID=UPI0026E17120|nr:MULTISPECIES: EAL domain-containing protein [unclassified Marinobacter]MDO6442600.1 EAL domain-containing protein [Marinobacter sp. 2_MG-2023]MDO6823180.1 EAL domain-containing protein [Marinobacter sp. 1_MG-2023]
MQKQNATVHLLILDPSQNDAESLVSLLRNAGRATRAHRITSEEDLEEALKSNNWDLLLARDIEQEFSADSALAMIRRMDKDIPCLFLTEEETRERTVAVMKAGAQGTVQSGHNDLLVLKTKRELAALEDRRRRRALESHLREAEQRCQLLLESSKDAIAYINDGMHIYANQSYLEFLGYDDIDDLMCVPVLDTLTAESQNDYKAFMKSFTEKGEDGMTINCTAKRSDDHELNVTMSVSAATYDSEVCTQIVLQPEHSDAELEEKLREISSQDLLTGLYNRQYLMKELEQTIASAGKNNETGALAYIALDNFITMKGQVGISGADLLLGDLATLLKEEAADDLVLARLSDDAFCLLSQSGDEKSLTNRCEQVRKAVEEHLFDINGHTVPLTVSIGIASITENSPKAEDLMARAHNASSEVRKQDGHAEGNGICAYNPANYETLDDGSAVDDILKALEDNRFRLLFQPIINLRGEGEEHYEAFVRMLDKDENEVSPYDFLPPLGPSDTAIKIDRWVILQTIKQLSSHRSKGNDTRMFLNVTAETLQDKTFTPWLSVALKAARLPGDSLIFQIREGDANKYMKQAKEFTKTLHQLHCKVSIAQFGCALNPFNTLKHIDTDYVKIDGSFTEEIQKNDEAREQVKEMVKSLQSSGKLTIIPLVENAAVLATLWQAGVNYIQGYYLQAPVPEMNYDFSDN